MGASSRSTQATRARGDNSGKPILCDQAKSLAIVRRHLSHHRSLSTLAGLQLTEVDLDRRSRHPALGEVTLRQLLARPWKAFLRIVGESIS
jgi:hypothetical protein